MSLFDDASLVLIPDGAKDSKLYSVKPTDGGGDFTFSRSTTATRVNESGLIESVATNVPRIDYSEGGCPSLLLEPQRTNLLTYSEDFSDADWLKVGVGSAVAPIVTADQGIAPDGTLTADRVQFDISVDNIANRSILRQSHSSINGPDHCRSFYVKSFDGTDQYISIHRGGASAQFTVTNDWQRIEEVGVLSGETFTGVELRGGLGSGSLTSDVLIWGAQLEAGSYPTSYIPTYGSSVTRSADSCTKTSISSLIGQTEGTLFFDVNISRVVGNEAIGTINSGGYANHATIQRVGSTIQFGRNSATQSGATIVTSATITAGRYKLAIAYKSGDTACFLNGAQVSTTQTQTFTNATLNTIKIGTDAAGALQISDSVKQSILFKTRLSNTELAALTTL